MALSIKLMLLLSSEFICITVKLIEVCQWRMTFKGLKYFKP